MIKPCAQSSLISYSVLRMGTACSFHQRQKIYFLSKVNGECPHLQFLSKLTILIYGKKLLQRVPLYQSWLYCWINKVICLRNPAFYLQVDGMQSNIGDIIPFH